MKYYFSADMDVKTIIISTVVFVILLYAGYDLFNRFLNGKTITLRIVSLFTSVMLFLAIIISLAYMPYGYLIDSDSVIIRRLINSVKVPYGEIKNVETVKSSDLLKNSLRIFGSGGFLGYFGRFKDDKNTFYLYTRRMGTYIKIETDNVKYVIAPDDVDKFVNILKDKIKH